MTTDSTLARTMPERTALLDTACFYRLRLTPQRPRDPDEQDPVPAHLFAALTAAHSDLSAAVEGDGLLAVAWQRLPGDPTVQILVGSRPTFTAAHTAAGVGDVVPILFPPGSHAERVDTRDILDTWTAFPAWIPCLGQPDTLWTPTDTSTRQGQLRGGFDDYVAHLGGPFVWLTVAQPLTREDLDRELAALQARIPVLRRRENDESSRVELLRAEGRFRELSRARASGVWSVRVLVGGETPAAARRAAALLCSSSDLDEHPYNLVPDTQPLPFHDAVDTATIADETGAAAPFTATSELLAALARPPKRELPGIRLTERAEFDLTPETVGPIHLGEILDDADQLVGTFTVGTDTLNRHAFVAGATGAGKSQTVRHILEQLHHIGTPWLVIEPAKAEYARMAGRIGEANLIVLHPGDPDAVPYGLNPLQPEPGFPLQTHIDLVRALFLAAFEPEEPFPQVLSQALDRCYRDLGWDPTISASHLPNATPRYPRLGDLHRTALAVVERIGYGKEIADNVRGFVDVRIRSLQLGTPGRFFDGRYPLDIADLLRRNVILEIEDIGTDTDQAFLIGAVLIRIVEHLRVSNTTAPAGAGLRHVAVVEEAHRLLKRTEPGTTTAHAVELFTALLAEVRAYGEGIMIAEQIPDKIVPDVIKNTALKIIHRLPAAEDRDAVGATMNLDDAQSRHVVSLPPGRAVAFTDGMDRPIRITVPYGEPRETRPARFTTAPRITLPDHDQRALPTSRQLAQAEKLATDHRLMLWIELLIAAHLAGWPAPNPDRTWLDSLTSQHPRTILDHAIIHRIQLGIDSRYIGLATDYQPETLAGHLIDAARHTLDAVTPPCDGTETQWRAGRYRWVDVVSALNDSTVPPHQPHPDTAMWARDGLVLAGNTIDEQLRALYACWHTDPSTIIGTDTPSIYEQATQALSWAADPFQRWIDVADFLDITSDWPLAVFIHDAQTEVSHDGN